MSLCQSSIFDNPTAVASEPIVVTFEGIRIPSEHSQSTGKMILGAVEVFVFAETSMKRDRYSQSEQGA
jgi:hypothetical protein